MVELAKAEDAILDSVELKDDGTYTCGQTNMHSFIIAVLLICHLFTS
jgi:hypothetical protein